MRTIYKYRIDRADRTTLKMPKGARVLTVQMQDDELTLWAEVNATARKEDRRFAVFGTGHEMPRDIGYSDTYIATVQDGPFVWHIYELTGV